MEPLWLCRDNFIRTSVRKVAGGTDKAFRRVAKKGANAFRRVAKKGANAFRRVAWEDSKRVDPAAAV
jgi:hypothetical protein